MGHGAGGRICSPRHWGSVNVVWSDSRFGGVCCVLYWWVSLLLLLVLLLPRGSPSPGPSRDGTVLYLQSALGL